MTLWTGRIYTVFRRWRKAGPWERLHDTLRTCLRQVAGKERTPTVAIVHSQLMRAAEGGEESGYDAGKKITGRKRHWAVDTLGLGVDGGRAWHRVGGTQ